MRKLQCSVCAMYTTVVKYLRIYIVTTGVEYRQQLDGVAQRASEETKKNTKNNENIGNLPIAAAQYS